jgi:hypothetical protein
MQFYVTKNGRQLGPFSLIDVRQRLQTGEFTSTDLAWRDGLKAWTPLSEIMGGSLPGPVPYAVTPPERTSLPQPTQTPTAARIFTAVVIFFVSFFVLFAVAFVFSCIIAGFCAGFQAGLHHEGTQAGGEAGRQIVQNYIGLITGGSALFSLVVSPMIAYFMAFSNLFPWCRAR